MTMEDKLSAGIECARANHQALWGILWMSIVLAKRQDRVEERATIPDTSAASWMRPRIRRQIESP